MDWKTRWRLAASHWESRSPPATRPSLELDRDLISANYEAEAGIDVAEHEFELRVAERLSVLPAPATSIYISLPADAGSLSPHIWIPRDALGAIASAIRQPAHVDRESLFRWLTAPRTGMRTDSVELPPAWRNLLSSDGLNLWLVRHSDSRLFCAQCRAWTDKDASVDTAWLAWVRSAFAGNRIEEFQQFTARCPQGHLMFQRSGPRFHV